MRYSVSYFFCTHSFAQSVPNARSAKLFYDTEVPLPSDNNGLQGFDSQETSNSAHGVEQRDLPRVVGSGLYALAGKCKVFLTIFSSKIAINCCLGYVWPSFAQTSSVGTC